MLVVLHYSDGERKITDRYLKFVIAPMVFRTSLHSVNRNTGYLVVSLTNSSNIFTVFDGLSECLSVSLTYLQHFYHGL